MATFNQTHITPHVQTKQAAYNLFSQFSTKCYK